MEPNISTGFNISHTDDITMDYISNKYPPVIVMTAISMFYIEATVHIYKKNKNDLEPIYIFELNTLANFAMFLIWRAYTLLEVNFLCSIRNCVLQYLRLNVSVGIIMSQLDRFFALYLHAEYRERVTPKLALVSLTKQKTVSPVLSTCSYRYHPFMIQ